MPRSAAINSATIIDAHTPSISQISGKSITAAVWNTIVLINEISAEVSPSLSAVKNPESKIANPINKNANENIKNRPIYDEGEYVIFKALENLNDETYSASKEILVKDINLLLVGFFCKNPALLQPKFGAFSSGRDGLRRFFPQK